MTAIREQISDRESRSCSFMDRGDMSFGMKSSQPLETLKRRPDFLRAARGARWITPGFIVQAMKRDDDEPMIRVGFTASKKVGNAVERNRAKRRLREIARDILPRYCKDGYDIVLVARKREDELPFDDLRRDLKWALKRLELKKEDV